MTVEELTERDIAAQNRLANNGWLAAARAWLSQNPPPDDWKGTAFEYAEEEMIIL